MTKPEGRWYRHLNYRSCNSQLLLAYYWVNSQVPLVPTGSTLQENSLGSAEQAGHVLDTQPFATTCCHAAVVFAAPSVVVAPQGQPQELGIIALEH